MVSVNYENRASPPSEPAAAGSIYEVDECHYTSVWRDNGATDRLSLYRDGMRAQRSTVLPWFIKRCGYRETNNF